MIRPEPRPPAKRVDLPYVPRPGFRPVTQSTRPERTSATLRDVCTGMYENVQEAAKLEAAARREREDMPPLAPPGEEQALIYAHVKRSLEGWVTQSRSEKRHWQERLSEYREYLRQHPELEDQPFAAYCQRHGSSCRPWFPAPEPQSDGRQPGEEG